jgi:LPS-assembly protein
LVGHRRPPLAARRAWSSARLKHALALGASLVALAAAPAYARMRPAPAIPEPQATPVAEPEQTGPGPDTLDPNSFYLEADVVAQDNKTQVATAQGHVEVRYRGRTLRSDFLAYDKNTQVVTARGNVVIVNPDGTSEFAKELTLDKDLSAGVALGFSARLQQNIKIASDTLIRRSADVTELNDAIYTPCDVCAKNGDSKTPTWSIQARRVVQDKAHHLIYFHKAVIRVLGVPVFYAPAFWTADPESDSRSGFLTPEIQYSDRRGLSFEQPYLWVLSPSESVTISPIVSTKINPFLNLDWRAKFNSGEIDARVGYTYEYEFDNEGQRVPGSDVSSRSYILANGAFALSNTWDWGFSAERESDDLLFDRYDIHDVYDRRGLFDTDSRRLLSQLYAVRQDQDSYLSISALDFQGVRVEDVNKAMPVVAPLIEARYEPEQSILGGRLILVGNAVVLQRDVQITDPTLPGADSRRATADADWRTAITLSDGIRIEPFGSLRGDVYSITNAATTGANPQTTPAVTVGRFLPEAGVDISYPLIKQEGDASIVLEPLAEGVISPRAKPDPDIPNEDSADFLFDDTNLFDPNRSPGFDVYDSGARLDLGGRSTVSWGNGLEANALIGRSFRSSPDLTLPANSGYEGTASNWIFAGSITPVQGLSFYDRTELDNTNFSLRREEAGANFMVKFLQGYVRYIYDNSDPANVLHDVEAAGNLYIRKNWGLVFYGTRDLVHDEWARRDIGIFFQNDCARVELVYHYEAGFAQLGGPSNSVLLRLTLATLGQQGYRDEDSR